MSRFAEAAAPGFRCLPPADASGARPEGAGLDASGSRPGSG